MEKNLGTAAKLATKNESIFKLFILIFMAAYRIPIRNPDPGGGKNDPQK
jgi:hypothetical protein